MADGPKDPLAVFAFRIDVNKKVGGYFTEVSGMGSETEVIEHKVISPDNNTEIVQKIPGRLKWGDVSLKRGITAELDVWTWRKMVEDGKVDDARASGSIFMFDQTGAITAQWDFIRAWPSKVSGPSINAGSSAVGIEEMTIVHEGIKRVK